MITCHICNEKFSEELFKGHPHKVHKIKLEDYLSKYFNKRDLLTNEKLPFKTLSQYLSNDFINRNNFRTWIKTNTKDNVKDYCIKWLVKRKEIKDLKYIPTQIELKSVVFPSINYLDELFINEGGYYKICEGLGYLLKHKKIDKHCVLPTVFQYNDDIKIIKDTREGKPLIFSQQTVTDTLNWGDYSLSNENLSSKVRIERKSLLDAIGTLSKGYARFCRELERAEADNGYVVILIEENFTNLLSFNFLPHIGNRVKATPEFILHRIREICQYFTNTQFLCVDGRRQAAAATAKIFQLGELNKNIDLQLAYDLGILV